MPSFKTILKKLFDRKYINKETRKKSDYDLLVEIMRKRKENQKKLRMLKQRTLELAIFQEILMEPDAHLYSEKELDEIYRSIMK